MNKGVGDCRPPQADEFASLCRFGGAASSEDRAGQPIDHDTLSVRDEPGGLAETWRTAFHKAGYPYWVGPAERNAWCRQHADQLQWNASEGFYMPSAGGGNQETAFVPESEPGT